jgi:hypothetical protein
MRFFSKSVFLTLCVMLGFGLLHAQTITGAFTGSVTDASGAAVPNAKVTATNQGTNVTFTANTNTEGIYNILFLPIGEYKIVTEANGFKKASAGPIKIQVNQTAKVDFGLQVGDATQTIDVTGSAITLQTESTQTGEVLSNAKLTELPLKGRNFVALTLLVPGAVSPNPEATNSRLGSRPYVNGNREQTNNFMLDGVDINDSIDNRVAYSPNVDALEEVRVLTGNAGAEFGASGGATVMLQMKSGTNQFHGNVFEFLRNNVLDANGFFRNRVASTAKRTGFKRNIFGGTLGGPIRKDRLFFFVDYEGTIQRADGPQTANVAPQAWRNGDLSSFPNVITDPLTSAPFPGKIIPTNRFSPVARALFANQTLYPLPNQAGAGAQGVVGNYAGGTASQLNNHQGDVKIDYRLSDKDNLMARYSQSNLESFSSRSPLVVQMTGRQDSPAWSAVLNWNRTISGSLVNEARVAFSRVVIKDSVIDWSGQLGADGNQKLGISGGQPIPGLSQVSIGGGLTAIGSPGVLSFGFDNRYILYDNLTWLTGKHQVKFGGQFMRYQQNRYYSGNNGALGLFSYGSAFTGLDFSDFLLDRLAVKGRGAATGAWGHRFSRPAFFVQDDYRVARNFTINLGLRYEYMTPIYEVADRQVNVNTYTGQLIRPNGQFGRATYRGYKTQFMPRFGFAWTPGGFNNKLVVRGGAAYQSFMEGTGANLRTTLNPPFFLETNFNYDARTPGSITTGFSDVVAANLALDMPRPAGVTVPQLQGRAWDVDLRPQTTNQFNFTVEYQLAESTVVSAGYVGQKGTHLVAPVEGNQPLPGVGAPSTWTNLNLRRPLYNLLPNLGNIARTESNATMDYHSLQMSAKTRMKSGLDVITSYTFGKTLTDNLGYYGSGFTSSEGAYWQNAYDRRSNRGPAFFDMRHVLAIGGSYAIPVGRSKSFGSGMSRLVDAFLGGWNSGFNMSLRSGLPLTVRAADLSLMAVRGNVRANHLRPLTVNESGRNVDNWFGLPNDPNNPNARANVWCAAGVDNGTCAYGQPPLGTFGTASIGTERGPGFFNLDMSLGKRFNLTERQYFDFRAEFFNLPNSVAWAPPGLNISAPASFGAITNQVNLPRNIQFGLKYFF